MGDKCGFQNRRGCTDQVMGKYYERSKCKFIKCPMLANSDDWDSVACAGGPNVFGWRPWMCQDWWTALKSTFFLQLFCDKYGRNHIKFIPFEI